MGSIIERARKDGSKAFTAQIVIKKGGVIVHREAETFDRKQAANAWVVKREAELRSPGGLERKEDPTLSAVIDRYTAESKNAVLGTKAQVLKTIKQSDLGDIKCSNISSQTLVSFAKELTKNVEPQTCGNYFSHLSNIFTVARPAWYSRAVLVSAAFTKPPVDVAASATACVICSASSRSRRPAAPVAANIATVEP